MKPVYWEEDGTIASEQKAIKTAWIKAIQM